MKMKLNKNEMALALDIGTRSVVGLLGSLEDQKLVVHHSVVIFHENRAMFDGQIHDIEEVAKVIKKVKEKLEAECGYELKDATIAAAGRALLTESVTVDLGLGYLQDIKRSHIQQIELKALQEAERQLEKSNTGDLRYFCVGHSIIQYYLDGALIKNPLNHKGKMLSVHLIATFLPKLVVDSLYASVTGAGLEVDYMTLEPIAAIEVAVPENARLLNIALVDIGAGTSDIAITKDGSIHAYAMTDVAGDELTEYLAREKMLDFDSAESIKCQISTAEKLDYEDILGIKHEETSDELIETISPAMKSIATQISESIIQHNGKMPSAVFLIGGGSRMKGLPKMISQALELPEERVSVRNISTIQQLLYHPQDSIGPEGITPIGILKKALMKRHNDFIEITINGRSIKLFQTRKLFIRDGLAALQYDPHLLIPKKGESIHIIVNGEEREFYGEYGEPAIITKNQEVASLETELLNGDEVMVQPATTGSSATMMLYDILNDDYQHNTLKHNGEFTEVNCRLSNGDEVSYKTLNHTIKDTNEVAEKEEEDLPKNKKSITFDDSDDHDTDQKNIIEIKYNGNPLTITTPKDNLIFVDLFDYIDFDRSKVQGELILRHNGQPAEYISPIRTKDEVWIYWA
ncbi:cell division protein FtsA [Tindallia californiensis]|uniref:Cell division protein FtsA n=1 Tax=Tindallia californiensis TaxID=159292 RepID=A0A1H3ICM6_9FIRM|nr:cell division FtsA domain-containing protein [Tindallia californiensis]SDY24614.1 cell division protein FtsA [Tindallia californiensis]